MQHFRRCKNVLECTFGEREDDCGSDRASIVVLQSTLTQIRRRADDGTPETPLADYAREAEVAQFHLRRETLQFFRVEIVFAHKPLSQLNITRPVDRQAPLAQRKRNTSPK